MPDARIRLVLVDDHPIILHGLQRLFEHEADIEVVRTCTKIDEAVDAVRAFAPDVLVLDLKMQDGHGLDVMRALKAEGRGCPTVILTAAMHDDELTDAMALGVAGIVLKESPPASVVDCVRDVHRGERRIDLETLTRAVEHRRPRPHASGERTPPLTPRETEIVRLVAQGLRNKELAQRLSITEGAVKIHLHNIYDKLGVDGRLELVLSAQQKGLV
jgi:two-component system, NarL family, nitrate/nitrite response regulator NarL